MKCPHCHQDIKENDLFCSYCGFKIVHRLQNCPNCGSSITDDQMVCSCCGYQLPLQREPKQHQRHKVMAIVLGFFFGGLGIHNFYLGYSSKGIIQLVMFLCGFLTFGLTSMIAVIWGWVETALLLLGMIDRDGDDHLLL